MGRPTIIAGNWKMHKTVEETERFIESLSPLVQNSQAEVFIAPPVTALYSASNRFKDSKIILGAHTIHEAEKGAFTGEIAADMLLEAGARFVIVGHSERRALFFEDSAWVNKKVHRALEAGLQPILCIGESLEERESGKTEEVLKEQLLDSLEDVKDISKIILAYEPVWAIGTGKTATAEMAQDAHRFCREILASKWGESSAAQVVIQYGGSVKPSNAREILSQPDIDGVLVGGASLDVTSFSQIVNFDRSPEEIECL